MPTPTDLVTDLPADFEVFGQAVDTSMADLKGGTSGQVLSKNSNTDMDFVWVTSDDANAIQNTIVDAKGDLIGATASDTPARLAVGANNTFLRANSAASTGLEWAGSYSSFTVESWGGWTKGNATTAGRYLQIGKMVHFTVNITLGSTSSIAGAMFIGFPVPAQTANNNIPIGNGRFFDVGTAAYPGQIAQNSADNFIVLLGNSAGTYNTEAVFSATVPFTWTTGDIIWIAGTYEAA